MKSTQGTQSTWDRKELLETIYLVQSGLGKKEEVEQALSLVFKDERIHTYNQTIAVSTPFVCGWEGALIADPFVRFLEKTKAKEVTLTNTGKTLVVETKKAKATFSFMDKIRMPLEEVPNPKEFSPLPEDFKEQVQGCLFSVSCDPSKPALMCVSLKGNKVTSCDNFRLTQRTMKGDVKDPFLFPADAAVKLLPLDIKGVSVGKSWIHFERNETIFSCRTHAKDYPDVSGLFKKDGVGVAFPDKAKAILERAAIFTKGDWEARVKITFAESSGFTVTSETEGIGSFVECCKADFCGKETKIIVNPLYLIDILDSECTAVAGKTTLTITGKGQTHIVCLCI